jgi:predicted phosphodiesterase
MHSRSHTRFVIALALLAGAIGARAAQDASLPNQPDSLKFAIIGDSGTGSSSQYKVAEKLIAARAQFPYEFVLMMGDNLYSGSGPKDYKKKFEEPYKALLDSGLKFYAALGNHDNTDERNYKPFNMGGQRYYTFKPKNGVRIFALDSNYMDQPQLQWLEKELTASGSDWKICFFHHPLYSSGMHGSDIQLRDQLEPLFLKHGVDVVFSGHEHFYERIKPQKGIYYFTSGGAAKLREGDVGKTELTAKSFDSGYHFMLIEITKDKMYFQAISDQGKTVDSGALARFSDQEKKKFATP